MKDKKIIFMGTPDIAAQHLNILIVSSVTDLLLNTYSSYLIPSTLHGGKAESPFQTRRAKRRPLSSVTVVDDFLSDALEFRNYAISQPFYEERIEGTGKKYK